LARHPVEVIFRVFARTGNQQILFFVHQILTLVFTQLEVRGQLDRRGRARFFAQAAEDAT